MGDNTDINVLEFNIEAISVPIVYNNYGDHDPNGMMYALKEDAEAIRLDALSKYNMYPPQTSDKVVPLVLRCHKGDVININFHNSLSGKRASIHVEGLNYNVITSDGASVGYNMDTTTSDTISYQWFADTEGTYLFHDLADPRAGEFTNIHGLFGAIIVEKPDSKWSDPVTGMPLKSGLFADVYPTHNKAFREYVVLFQDELAVIDKDKKTPIDPHTGQPSSTMGISYRSEPMRNRMVEAPHILPEDAQCVKKYYPDLDSHVDPGHGEHVLTGEDVGMSSWTFRDPATFLLNAYVGDSCIIRLLHAGVKETHVMHIHNHQWRLEPENPNSVIIDSQSISPQETYDIDILYGAGSLTHTIGDVIWHCHLYPHFMEGMWGLWRIFERLEDGTGKLPDGTPIPELKPLRDRAFPLKKDLDHPGYPNFINSTFPSRVKQPPLGIINPDGSIKTIPTQLELDNFVNGYAPGALYSKTCPSAPPCHPDKIFEIAVVQADIKYNSFGWHDPQGRFMVLRQEAEKYGGLKQYLRMVRKGKVKVEPLIIRANAGDCIEIRYTNMLPLYLKENKFEPRTLTDIVGFHIHLVKFDTISADGSANGWCNMAGAFQCETLVERFYADEELHTVFCHDHLYPNSHQQHGLFGALIVEPKGSCFYDPYTRGPISYGTKAIIQREDCTEYREYAIAVHDFAYLFDRRGIALNPPDVPGSHDDPGVMAVNYRCEPLRERLGNQNSDPAYIFSSYVHGDPATPLIESYPGDEIMIRLFQGAQEEQHCFNIVGMKWEKELQNLNSPTVSSQTLGISEAFNIHMNRDYGPGDYLYHFGGIDDIWLGAWGIIRVYKNRNERLSPICNGAGLKSRFIKIPRRAHIRKYEIAAIQTPIKYNKYNDHDPNGLVFVPMDDYNDIVQGKKDIKPLILRANKGDYIQVTLYNKFTTQVPYFDYPFVPLEKEHVPSNRVSIAPQFLQLNNIKDGGVNVGFYENEQTVAPGESRIYTWHADSDYGTCMLSAYGDIRNHRYHGLFGAIIIEPEKAVWSTQFGNDNADHAEQVVVSPSKQESFVENVLFIQNGIRLLDNTGKLIKTVESEDENGEIEEADAEDTGEKGYNYRSERFYNRFQTNNLPYLVFSSKVHGDPATPLFKMYTGQKVLFRTLMPADKPRNVSFLLHGHMWPEHPLDRYSRIIPVQGHISIGNVFDMPLIDGASLPGDYLYRSGSLRWDVESGMWGIMRVYDAPVDCECKPNKEKFICRVKKFLSGIFGRN